MKNYEIKIEKLENGNGYIYSTVISGFVCGYIPNNDIGETYENRLGFETEGEAIIAAAGYIKLVVDEQERYDQHKADLLLEQM